MDFECPLCNALINISENCPLCKNAMVDSGPIEDYLDPYSPYLDRDIITMGRSNHKCVHLFSCPVCGYDSRIVVNQIPV